MKQAITRTSGDKTRDDIIKAAKALFAKQGFAATSISQIASKAKVTRALIFHHFTNKEELWKRVKASFLDNLKQSGSEDVSHPIQSLQAFIEYIVTQRFALYNNHPDAVRMMVWQGLEKQTKALQGGTPASPDSWITNIKQLQKRGEIASTLDPELIALFIASSISGALMSNTTLLNSEKKKIAYQHLVSNSLFRALTPNSHKNLSGENLL